MRAAVLCLASLVAACGSTADRDSRLESPVERGEQIVVCGQRFAAGTRVVLWTDPGGYSAYDTGPHFADEGPEGLRYRPGRKVADPALQERIDDRGITPEELRGVVDQFVLHYDACGVSRECFRILQDVRQLSVHFLLDVDGTIYQTLDLADQAWHAAEANPRSIGIEIAQIGAYPADASGVLDEWYEAEGARTRLTLPERLGDGGVRTPGWVGYAARPERIAGEVQGAPYVQYDFTPEQYEALVKLAATLCEVFPDLRPIAPRDATGAVAQRAVEAEDLAAFGGIVGHHHITTRKRDPGPAFDWERFLAGVRGELAARGRSELARHRLQRLSVPGELEGVWLSPVVESPQPFDELLPSWNVATPGGSGFRVEARVSAGPGAPWSPWLFFGEGGDAPPADGRTLRFDGGAVEVDVLRSERPLRRFQVRLTGRRTDAAPVAASVTVVTTDTAVPGGLGSSGAGRETGRLPVPYRSQLAEAPELATRVCSPTSLAMVLDYRGVSLRTAEVAARCFDARHDLYGNWSRNVQAAYELGVPGYVARFSEWDEVEPLLAAGQPLVISVRADAGELDGAPYPETAGHLLVLVGTDGEGRALVNDPAAGDAATGLLAYDREQLTEVWLRRNGVAYVLEERVRP